MAFEDHKVTGLKRGTKSWPQKNIYDELNTKEREKEIQIQARREISYISFIIVH
ncbi:hypothetical protein [Methanosarcina sp. 2.H.A.1B.4]|uniref:hypothetical protein n=1 Tax=Methanosarcina sp. 2.H.A.1B.4 TaxID=1483600 RepID=UPI000AF3C1A7|nr:hypothetical protein [Methanosarcina sp. 2.H.A.1B.4]